MIIAIAGRKGSGKDTVAAMIESIYRAQKGVVVRIGFADPMKDFCQRLFGWSSDTLWGPSELREVPDPAFTRPDGTPLTPRYALQTLGTEWGRNCDPALWAKVGVRAALTVHLAGYTAVITDCRFANEAALVREAGGQVWFLERFVLASSFDTHPSETEMMSPVFQSFITHRIANHGTKEQLRQLVEVALVR